ncbi:MAG TPA: N4-gp56 family major capsid protein [Candidatus Avimonoglobus intestinipullorum]|uniref:N4-gp56 family major capsid protein n=1 Tax=Candidatus Avimonoglobus intestinipullorum TaxID=2840699 RepID=A0A9D1LUP5_9FIRM|nr:N4-gp56 family major capsid protein [Candidatus Avimonoglobus intestinipullorum]
MATGTTKIANLINPEVMADMISAKIPKKIVVAPFAAIDLTLVGQPGDTITVPQYAYIGDAAIVGEGVECEVSVLSATTTQAQVKKAMKAVELTDEAVLSGYGNPVAETNNQLAASIASKIDEDAMTELQKATLTYDGSAGVISYDGIVDALDVFEEEANTQKVIFVHPKQVTQLRHDPDFVSADKYPGNVVMTGEIGMIANCRVVPSKKVPLADDVYKCPIIKLAGDPETEDESQAITIYLKRDTTVETQRQSLKRITDISADKYYTVVLSNASKVVLAKFKATEPVQSSQTS